MLDHIFHSVSYPECSIAFYKATLAPLDITTQLDYDGKTDRPAIRT